MSWRARVGLSIAAAVLWIACACLPAGSAWCVEHRPPWCPADLIWAPAFVLYIAICLVSVACTMLAAEPSQNSP